MKKILALILVLILALPLMASAVAESGQVVLSVGSAFTTFFNPYFQGTMIGYTSPTLAYFQNWYHEDIMAACVSAGYNPFNIDVDKH